MGIFILLLPHGTEKSSNIILTRIVFFLVAQILTLHFVSFVYGCARSFFKRSLNSTKGFLIPLKMENIFPFYVVFGFYSFQCDFCFVPFLC